MLEFLDGGMIYELNKIHQDLGQTALLKEPEAIEKIYQSYVNSGSNYLTSCNYGYKSLKLDNWKELTEKAVNLLSNFQKKHNLINATNTIKTLGCFPPYFESYHGGKVDNKFRNFYWDLVDLMDGKVDYYILETQVDINHIREILKIINLSSKKTRKVWISIYPEGNITFRELTLILNEFPYLIEAVLLNCCSLEIMQEYFQKLIGPQQLVKRKIKFGFYLNKLDQEKYKNYDGDKKKTVDLTNFYDSRDVDYRDIDRFRNELNGEGYNLIIGGCCGYGTQEMEELIQEVKYLSIKGTARL